MSRAAGRPHRRRTRRTRVRRRDDDRLDDDLVLDDQGRDGGRRSAQQWQGGALDVDDRVVGVHPEFGAQGKDTITLAAPADAYGRHSVERRHPRGRTVDRSRAENLARIYAAPLDYEPGTRAGYHPAAGMSVLGEIVAHVSGLPYDQYVRDCIFVPLGMVDCWVGMPDSAIHRIREPDRRDAEHRRFEAGACRRDRFATRRLEATARRRWPRPMRQLGRMYESLLGLGRPDPRSRHRRHDLGTSPHRAARREFQQYVFFMLIGLLTASARKNSSLRTILRCICSSMASNDYSAPWK